MLIEMIKSLGNKYGLKNLQFEKIFRDKALGKNNEQDCFVNVKISINEFNDIMKFKKEFANIFFDDDSHWLLWVCKCLYNEKKSILSYFSDYISKVCNIKRGNLNTYKLNGWDVHILYVYQLVNYNFKKCIIPQAYFWKFDVNPIFKQYNVFFLKLTDDSRFLLKIGSFLHDIGVVNGVKDHETNGVALTEKYYDELGVTESLLTSFKIHMSYEEIIVALKAMIGNHQIINQISAEASDQYIYEKVKSIEGIFQFSEKLMYIYNEDFVSIMSILAISDLIAVDDSLLTYEKYKELNEANSFLHNIIKNNEYRRDEKTYGIKRFISLLNDDLKNNAINSIENIFRKKVNNGSEFINFIYHVKLFSYAMAAIKPLSDIEKSVRLIEVCMEIFKLSNIKLSDLIIKFNPDVNNEKLQLILNESPIDIVSKKLIEYTIIENDNTIEISCI